MSLLRQEGLAPQHPAIAALFSELLALVEPSPERPPVHWRKVQKFHSINEGCLSYDSGAVALVADMQQLLLLAPLTGAMRNPSWPVAGLL